jgi:nicotinamidase-related amidase
MLSTTGIRRGEVLVQYALPAAKKIAALKHRAKLAGIPAIYVNDNFGKWRSDFTKLVAHVINDQTRGRPIAELLRPEAKDYFVLKPKHSGFFSTSLNLPETPGRRNLDLAGWASDICILFTATMHTCVSMILQYRVIALCRRMKKKRTRTRIHAKGSQAEIRPVPELDWQT